MANRAYKTMRRIGALLGVLVLWHLHANAQGVLVETTTLTAARQAAGVYLHTLDLESTEPLPPPQRVPGVATRGPLLVTRHGRGTVVTSQAAARGDTPLGRLSIVSAYSTVPLHAVPQGRLVRDDPFDQVAGAIAYDPATGAPLVALLTTLQGVDGNLTGRLDVARCGIVPHMTFEPGLATRRLPGPPVAAVVLPNTTMTAVLCRSPDGSGSMLHVRDLLGGAVAADSIELTDAASEGLGNRPDAIAVSDDGRYLYALTSGYAFDHPAAAASSWLHVIDTETYAPVGPPVRMPGTPQGDDAPLHPSHAGTPHGCWVATRTPSAGFAYLTHVAVTESGLDKDVEHSFTNIIRPLRVETDPAGPGVAVASGNHVEVWADGRPPGDRRSFQEPVGALLWIPGSLIIGEAGRIHLFDIAAEEPTRTIQLQTGVVTRLAHIRPSILAWRDLDEDGVPDAVDPEQGTPSPSLNVPSIVTFGEKANGNELHVVRIEGPHAQSSEWRVQSGRASQPWLHVYPQRGIVPGWFLMGVDPAYYASSGRGTLGSVRVHLTGADSGRNAAGSPARIDVRVVPEEQGPNRILWVVDSLSAHRPADGIAALGSLRPLAELLAAAPRHFSHRVARRYFAEPLSPHSVVVVDAASAARGAITASALLDYAAQGGSVLFLGSHMPDPEGRSVSRWLAPAGIVLDPSEDVDGVFANDSPDGEWRHWGLVHIMDGCRVAVEADDRVVARMFGTRDQAAFAAIEYGLGRIAVLAGATPLESPALAKPEPRRFAVSLFGWLGRAGKVVADLDADGLPDRIEDTNDNGAADPGETDRLNADADGDGIPDGLEDANRNGRTDPGETSPLNPDTDGDGIHDGADYTPLPPADAPVVVEVRPGYGPASGGTHALILGRNFPRDARASFGEQPSPSVRFLDAGTLMAEVPAVDSESATVVDVRVTDASAGHEAVLPAGFRYRTGKPVRLDVRLQATAMQQYGGEAWVQLTCEEMAGVGPVQFRLRTEPEGLVRWTRATRGPAAQVAERRVVTKATTEGALTVAIGAGKGAFLEGILLNAAWESDKPMDQLGPLTIVLDDVQILSIDERPLEVETGSANVPARTP
ncbi:MAG: hypothetical protein GY851_24105 [bacterium]|nr:hypothetical protein [bacterium]